MWHIEQRKLSETFPTNLSGFIFEFNSVMNFCFLLDRVAEQGSSGAAAPRAAEQRAARAAGEAQRKGSGQHIERGGSNLL